MPWKPRFSLRLLLVAVAIAAMATFASLNWRQWRRDYLDWRAASAVRSQAEKVFRDEAGAAPPAELVHILGSGDLAHWGSVDDIGLTADQIISCGSDRAVRCWSTETGEPLQVITAVEGHIAAHSSLLATIDDKQLVKVYDTSISPLAPLRTFSLAGGGKIEKVVVSSVGGELAVYYAAKPNEIQFFDLNTGQSMSVVNLEGEAADFDLAFRETRVVLLSNRERTLVVDPTDGNVGGSVDRRQWRGNHRPRWNDKGPEDVRSNPRFVRLQSPWWLVVTRNTSLVWNETTNESREFDLASNDLRQIVAGINDDAWVVSSGAMVRVMIFDGEPTHFAVPTTPFGSVRCMAFRPGPRVPSVKPERAIGYGASRGHGKESGQVALLDEFGKVLLPREDLDHIVSIAWNGQDDVIAAGTSTGEIVLIAAGTWREQNRYRAHSGPVVSLEFSPDGASLLSQQIDEVAVSDWRSGNSIARVPTPYRAPQGATLSSGDGNRFTYVARKGWELTDLSGKTLVAQSAKDLARPGMASPLNPIWVESDGCFVVFGDGAIGRVKIAKDRHATKPTLEISEKQHPLLGRVLDFSPQRSRVLAYDDLKERRRLRIWDWNPPAMREIDLGKETAFHTGTFSPSTDKVAAVLGSDLVVFADDGAELYRHRIGPDKLIASAIEYSPDGRYIAVVNGNGTCYIVRNPVSDGKK